MRQLKKIILLATIIMTATFAITVTSAQSTEIRTQLEGLYRNINLIVDGKKMNNVKDSYVFVDGGRVMVPIGTVSEALGVNVDWNENTNEVRLTTPVLEIKSHPISQLAVLRNVGPFYTSNDFSVSIAQKRFSSGLLLDGAPNLKAEFVVKLDQKYKGFETYVGVEDNTQNSSSNFVVSFYADDRLLDSPGLRINQDNPVKPAQYARWLKYDGLEDAKRLTVRVEFISNGEDIGEYPDLTAAFGNFSLLLK